MTNNLALADEEKVSPKPLLPSEQRADIVVPLEPLSQEAQHRLVKHPLLLLSLLGSIGAMFLMLS